MFFSLTSSSPFQVCRYLPELSSVGLPRCQADDVSCTLPGVPHTGKSTACWSKHLACETQDPKIGRGSDCIKQPNTKIERGNDCIQVKILKYKEETINYI